MTEDWVLVPVESYIHVPRTLPCLVRAIFLEHPQSCLVVTATSLALLVLGENLSTLLWLAAPLHASIALALFLFALLLFRSHGDCDLQQALVLVLALLLELTQQTVGYYTLFLLRDAHSLQTWLLWLHLVAFDGSDLLEWWPLQQRHVLAAHLFALVIVPMPLQLRLHGIAVLSRQVRRGLAQQLVQILRRDSSQLLRALGTHRCAFRVILAVRAAVPPDTALRALRALRATTPSLPVVLPMLALAQLRRSASLTLMALGLLVLVGSRSSDPPPRVALVRGLDLLPERWLLQRHRRLAARLDRCMVALRYLPQGLVTQITYRVFSVLCYSP